MAIHIHKNGNYRYKENGHYFVNDWLVRTSSPTAKAASTNSTQMLTGVVLS